MMQRNGGASNLIYQALAARVNFFQIRRTGWFVTLLNRASRPVGTIYIGATRGTVKRTEGMFAGATMEDVENDVDAEDATAVISSVKRRIKRAFHKTQEEARGMFERVKRSFSDFINRE